jgi:uncharacterized protein with HEPN domain
MATLDNSVRTDEQRIGDIVEHAARASEYAHELGDAAVSQIAPGDVHTSMTRAATIQCLTIVGLAASGLSAECRAKYPHVPWERVVALRQFHGKPDRLIDFDDVRHAMTNIVPLLLMVLRC